MLKNKKRISMGIGIIVILILVSIILILCIRKEGESIKKEIIDKEQLIMDFDRIFGNQENEYIDTLYNVKEKKTGAYEIEAQIPYIQIENQIYNKINKEINDIFVVKLLKIMEKSETYSTLKIDYATTVNETIVSLAIRCVLKEESRPKRTIIKTYNFDIQNHKEIKIMDVIPEEKKEEIQNDINQKIEKQIDREELIIQQGYNIYRRDKESSIYLLENATEFYIKDDILYIIYSYGNNNYTSEIDLIVNRI